MIEKEQKILSNKWPESIEGVLNLPSGAEYFRCALQVNPFGYLKTNRGEDHGLSEQEYNTYLVSKCLESGIKVIAITDHKGSVEREFRSFSRPEGDPNPERVSPR